MANTWREATKGDGFTEPCTASHWIDLARIDGTDETWMTASVKWDGCIHLTRYFNAPVKDPKRNPEDCDTLHICSLDELIGDLLTLREKAREHFGPDWPSA